MIPNLIVMLTHHDVTVPDARERFLTAADLPVQYWGFKDVGLSHQDMGEVVAEFKAHSKTVVMEVVNFEEKELIDSAAFAIDYGVDYVTGGRFSRTVAERLRTAGVQYFPFCGEVGGSPVTLTGTREDIIADARSILEQGASGVDLVAYRYAQGGPVALAATLAEEVGPERVIVAGSINSRQRIALMTELGCFGYTMGGVLFEGGFDPAGTFRDNLELATSFGSSLTGEVR